MADEWYEKVFENKHDVVNDFIQRKEDMGRSPRTLNAYSRTLKKFFHEVFPDVAPDEVQVYHIEEYVSTLSQRDLSQNTKRRYLESLSSFYDWAMKRPRFDTINGNPAAVVLEEIPKVTHDRPDCATWENGKEIVHNIANPRDKAVAAVLAKTGCRVKEATRLALDDVMLEDQIIRFRNRKNGKDTRFPIDDELCRVIQRYKFVRDPSKSDDLLFTSIRGGELTRERIRRSVRQGAVEAGIMDEGEDRFHKKFTPHTYRTVFTNVMRDNGMDDHITRYLRGDAKVQEAMDIYTNVNAEKARKQYLECIKPLEL
jgi:integrase/recombinase XerD